MINDAVTGLSQVGDRNPIHNLSDMNDLNSIDQWILNTM
jgi:hypothetical protein